MCWTISASGMSCGGLTLISSTCEAPARYLGIAARYAVSSPCTLIWHIASARDVQPFRFRSLRTLPFDYIDKKMIEYGIRHADYIFGQAQYQEDLLRQNYGRTCDLIVGNWHPRAHRALPQGTAREGRVGCQLQTLEETRGFRRSRRAD